MDITFERLQVEMQEVLLLGAIPHILDSRVGQLLFSESAEISLKTIRSFRFTSELKPGQIEYHELARGYLLDVWRRKDPDRFRQISGLLAKEFKSRIEEFPGDSAINASEWLFHNLVVDPANGMRLVANLFDEMLESRELGSAERLMNLVKEQEDWIDEQAAWLEYFDSSLAFSHYKDIDTAALERQVAKQEYTLSSACCYRLMGRIAIRHQRWANGRTFLLSASKIFNHLGASYYRALTYMDLGDLLQNLVENSGGILVETREFSSLFHNMVYNLSRGPLLFYRLLSERIDSLPNLYNMNYQNWVTIHFMRQALRNYRSAERLFQQINNRRGQAELNSRMAKLLFTLSHIASAEQLCKNALHDQFVNASPYYIARFQSILGQVAEKRGQLSKAIQQLSTSLKTLERYEDWDVAAHTALVLGDIYDRNADLKNVLDTYQRCLKAADESQNILLRSEIARRLEMLAQRVDLSFFLLQRADELHRGIKEIAFIDRFPGPIQKAFQKLSSILAYPFVFVFLLALVAGSGISMQIIEGELTIPNLPPITWLDVFKLLIVAFLPLFMIWAYYLAYFLFGQIAIRLIPFSRVDESQPDLFFLDKRGITQSDQAGMPTRSLAWQDIKVIVIDNRSLYRRPLVFSSSIEIYGKDTKLRLPGSTFRYAELEKKLSRNLTGEAAVRMIKNNLSLLHIGWLVFALLLGFTVSYFIVFGLGIVNCYVPVDLQDLGCPQKHQLIVQPIMQFGLFFSALFFGIISLTRWILTDRKLKKVSKYHE